MFFCLESRGETSLQSQKQAPAPRGWSSSTKILSEKVNTESSVFLLNGHLFFAQLNIARPEWGGKEALGRPGAQTLLESRTPFSILEPGLALCPFPFFQKLLSRASVPGLAPLPSWGSGHQDTPEVEPAPPPCSLPGTSEAFCPLTFIYPLVPGRASGSTCQGPLGL